MGATGPQCGHRGATECSGGVRALAVPRTCRERTANVTSTEDADNSNEPKRGGAAKTESGGKGFSPRSCRPSIILDARQFNPYESTDGWRPIRPLSERGKKQTSRSIVPIVGTASIGSSRRDPVEPTGARERGRSMGWIPQEPGRGNAVISLLSDSWRSPRRAPTLAPGDQIAVGLKINPTN